jgi:hypothetical protein
MQRWAAQAVVETEENMAIVLTAPRGSAPTVPNRPRKLNEALRFHEEALQIRRTCFSDSHVDVARTQNNIACLYRDQGDKVQARALFREAAEVYTTVYGADHSETVDALDQAEEDEDREEEDEDQEQDGNEERKET